MVGTLTFWVDAIFVTLGIAMAILIAVTPWIIAGAADRKFFPDDDAIERGSHYYCQIDRNWRSGSHSGKVWDVHDVIRWQFGTRRNPLGRSRGNLLNKPDFVFTDADGKNELIIRRVRFLPSVFHMLERDQVIGRIRLRSIVQYKYAIEVAGVDPLDVSAATVYRPVLRWFGQ